MSTAKPCENNDMANTLFKATFSSVGRAPTDPATPEELGKFCRLTWQALTINLERDSAFDLTNLVWISTMLYEIQYTSSWALAESDLSEDEAHFSP